MPADDEDEYEDDGGNEMVDLEDDEAQPENDQLQNNKIGGQELNAYDENRQPANEKQFTAQAIDPNAPSKPHGENAYQPGAGIDMQQQNNGF